MFQSVKYLIDRPLHTLTHAHAEVSTRMVSEYKTKLQISDAEKSRLEGTVSIT